MRSTKTELQQKIGKVLRASYDGPVIITDHGEDSHVLMTIKQYRELTEKKEKQTENK